MIPYSFLTEGKILNEVSYKKIYKRLLRYPIERRPKVLSALKSTPVEKGGLPSAEELAANIVKGQKRRIQSDARKLGRLNPLIYGTSDLEGGRTFINGSIIDPHQSGYELTPRAIKAIEKGRDVFRLPNKSSAIKTPLTRASYSQHEGDELSAVMKNSKRLNQSLDATAYLDSKSRPAHLKFSHFSGNVLKREKRRNKILDTLYPENKVQQIPRSKEEEYFSSLPIEKWLEILKKGVPQEFQNIHIDNIINKANNTYKSRLS